VAKLLLVGDDPDNRRALYRALTDLGHDVTGVPDNVGALRHLLDQQTDLVVVNLEPPDPAGLQALHAVRSVSPVAVIVVTGRDEESQIVQALDAGADDYLIKPFGAGQLDARIRVVLRRYGCPARPRGYVRVGELRIDPAAREASLAGTRLDLTAREFDLLSFLAAHAGTVVTKRDLLAHVWRQPWGGADKTVDVHLSWLRRKLGESAHDPRYLHTIRGVGIKLVAPAPSFYQAESA
jgi:DNA-binding response OmpR family regulator